MNYNNSIGIGEYHTIAMSISLNDGHDRVDNGVMGLVGASGAIVELIRAHMYHNRLRYAIPRLAIVDKIGDVLWSLEELAEGMNTTMSHLAECSFEELHEQTYRATRTPTAHKVALNLSSHANKIRRSAEHGNRRELEIQMRRMLYCCAWMARVCGYALPEVVQTNVEKIKGGKP